MGIQLGEMELIAASSMDTVKIFDLSVESGDPCTLTLSPSPNFHVNSITWNHNDLVVASAGDDMITFCRKNGQSLGTIPLSGIQSGDSIQEDIFSINLSNKTSRYLCSGGSGKVVRIWDLQRKCCIKWLEGHSGSISSAMYNCIDEHLASISLKGDLIVHDLASGDKAAELKDPHGQVLRVLDYSRVSPHLLATAGDDGSVHMWDTISTSQKISWIKQHSAPTAGLSFSPSNDKIIATVGLDKKLYTFDSGMKQPSFWTSYDTPFSSLAFREDGMVLAAGTSNGCLAFYDIRGKSQPFILIQAYANSEAVTSLCWQRSKPIAVNEKNCTAEVALLGKEVEESILMPGPWRSNPEVELNFAAIGAETSTSNRTSSLKETPYRRSLFTDGPLPRLHPTQGYNIKDDMQVFSPLGDVQQITPSFDKLWNDVDGSKKDQPGYKKISPVFPNRKFAFSEGVCDTCPIFYWNPFSVSKQDDIHEVGSTSISSTRSDDLSSITLPEGWGGERLTDKFQYSRSLGSQPSRFSMSACGSTSTSMFTGVHDQSASQSSTSYSTSASLLSESLRAKDVTSGQEYSPGTSGHLPISSLSWTPGSKSIIGLANSKAIGPSDLNSRRKITTCAERISTSVAINDSISSAFGSPKIKKTGAGTWEELPNSLLARDTTYAAETGLPPSANGVLSLQQRMPQADFHLGSSNFTLQLFQNTLEETLSSFQKSIHEDVRNLHLEILSQFHITEMELSAFMNSVLDELSSLTEKMQDLKKENERLRQLL